MPTRILPALPSRRRPPITNKSRLKVVRGNIDGDIVVFDDEDEKTKAQRSVAGVDHAESNEHHLLAVLQRKDSDHGPSRAAAAPSQFIPTPDSTGSVANYDQLYPAGVFKDSHNFLMSSYTVEDKTMHGLTDGFTYYMDERDKEWLDKNNEEARGEGTSALGGVTSPTTRHSPRSTRGKGKEPDSVQAIKISEDEFELIMGIFEKTTHEKTPFLHHSLSGMSFPAFSEYQHAFENQLDPKIFSYVTPPKWLPQPPQLCHMAKLVYPHWRERRMERGGQRIIPTLNFDESDTLNESYVCFRRRDVKAVRKTRAAQQTSGEKLVRLKHEFNEAMALVQLVYTRERAKREFHKDNYIALSHKMKFANIKRQNPLLGAEQLKEDMELLFSDRKRSEKRKAAPPREEMMPRPSPSRKLAHMQAWFDQQLSLQKQKDKDFDDFQDYAYQPPPPPPAARLFKYYSPPAELAAEAGNSAPPRQSKPLRLRYGRGGRLHVDRRLTEPLTVGPKRRRLWIEPDENSAMVTDPPPSEEAPEPEPGYEEREMRARVAERWRFDEDDTPAVGPQGSEEYDRVLLDDFDLKYQTQSMKWLTERDYNDLATDQSIPSVKNGQVKAHIPYYLGQMIVRRGPPNQIMTQQMNGSPAISQRIRIPAEPMAVRISSNGGMPPRTPPANGTGSTNVATTIMTSSPAPGSSGVATPLPPSTPPAGATTPTVSIIQPIPVPAVSVTPAESAPVAPAPSTPYTNGAVTSPSPASTASTSPTRPSSSQPKPAQDENQNQNASEQPQAAANIAKSQLSQAQAQPKAIVNGYQIPIGNAYPAVMSAATAAQFLTPLKPDQVQALRGAFAGVPAHDLNALRAAGYLPISSSQLPANFNVQLNGGGAHPNGMNLKIPANAMRAAGAGPVPQGWPPASVNMNTAATAALLQQHQQHQHQHGVNGVNGHVNANVNGSPSPRPRSAANVNGVDAAQFNATILAAAAAAQAQAQAQAQVQSGSPPRPTATPAPAMR